MDQTPLTCSVCEQIPREVRCYTESGLPEAFAQLEPAGPVDQSGPRTCPVCGAVYDLRHGQTWESSERLPTVEIRLTRRVENPSWDALSDGVPYKRTDAAYALAQQDGVDLTRLLSHQDAQVREHALQGLLDLPFGGNASEVRSLLDDPVPSVRALAVKLFWREIKESASGPAWDWLVENLKNLPVDAAGLLLGYVVHSESGEREAFAPIIEQALHHTDKELRQRAARGLAWLAEGNCQKDARIDSLIRITLEDSEWEVRLAGLSALSSMVTDWGDKSPDVLQALSQALRDVKLRYSLVRAMRPVLHHHDISVCLPSLIEIVLTDHAGYVDDACRLICKALEKGLDRPQLVTELLPGLELENESDRGSVCVCYRQMVKRGWDLRPAYDRVFNRLTSAKPSFVECDLAADLASPLLVSVRSDDRDRLDSLLHASNEVAGAVTRALATLARQGRDLSPVVSTLKTLLLGPDWVAQGAKLALDEHARAAGKGR